LRLKRGLHDHGLGGTIRKVCQRVVARLGKRWRALASRIAATSEFLSLELPANGAIWGVGELYQVAGWLDSKPGSVVHIHVDGHLCGVVPADVPRPDVTAARGTYLNCGFSYYLPPEVLSRGTHEITVSFIKVSGTRLQRSARIEVRETSVGETVTVRERLRRFESPRVAYEVMDAHTTRVADYSQGCIDAATIRNVLVVKTDHIGDCVLALPAIECLNSMFPQARFAVVCGSWSREFFESLQLFDSVIPFDVFWERSGGGVRRPPGHEIEAVAQQLRVMHFDLAIDLRRNPESRWILGLAGARYSVGFTGSSEFQPVIERELSRSQEDRRYNRDKPHMSRQLMELVSHIPVQRFDRIVLGLLGKGICSRVEARERLIQRLAEPSEVGEGTRLVGIHPGAGDEKRKWPIDAYSELAMALSREPNTYICLFGGRNDSEEMAAVANVGLRRSTCFTQLPYRDFLELLRGLDVFVGNNSGPGHLAAALGVPTVIVYSGNTSPEEWAPIGERVIVVDYPVACSPCYLVDGDTCPFDVKCLSKIKASTVLKAIASLTDGDGTRMNT
jgi:ADP-heptose:LPS heptosyltransferase